jgi:uncharacterized protein YndB with AHSA1/START domain
MARTDRASRLIKASAQSIYRAFIEPAALAAWLPPEGMTGAIELFEPRPGGRYRMRLTYDDPHAGHGKSAADADVVEGRFVELVPSVRIVQEAEFESDDPAFAGTMTMTWSFAAVPGGTEVTILAENVPAGISKQEHDEGLRSSLENLAKWVE